MSEPLITTPVLRLAQLSTSYCCDEFGLCADGVQDMFELAVRPTVIRVRVWSADGAPHGDGKRIRLTRRTSTYCEWSYDDEAFDGFYSRASAYIFEALDLQDNDASLDVYVELEEITEDE